MNLESEILNALLDIKALLQEQTNLFKESREESRANMKELKEKETTMRKKLEELEKQPLPENKTTNSVGIG
jgi:hypothetical protein